MPYKLVAPSPGRSPYRRVRGSEFGIAIDRTTQRTERREAAQILAQWREEAKRASVVGPVKVGPTFAEAALAYKRAGGVSPNRTLVFADGCGSSPPSQREVWDQMWDQLAFVNLSGCDHSSF